MGSVTLDPLPLKRVLAIEESGIELYPPESSQEEKPLSLLQSLDFERPIEKERKKGKKDGASPAWPWQGLIEQFHQAREELVTLLDFIAHVESNEALSVTNMMKPKPLPNEACADLALRTASKSRNYKGIAKYMRRNAKALERQVERESVFYEALMRLQRNWKVKRQRGVSAGPGGKAGFLIDMSFPLSIDPSLILSPRTAAWTLIKVDQDANGLLTVQLPLGKCVSMLEVYLGDNSSSKSHLEIMDQGHNAQHSSEGITSANLRLRDIQLSMFDELVWLVALVNSSSGFVLQIFECLCRESLQPSSATSLFEIGETSLDIGMGAPSTASFRLLEKNTAKGTIGKEDNAKGQTHASSLRIYLQQGFYSMLIASGSQGRTLPVHKSSKDDSANLLKDFSILVRHRDASDKIISLLDKLVLQVPNLWFRSHPTWKPVVSAWDVYFDFPQSPLKGSLTAKHQEWNAPATRATFQCRLVLRQESLTVEGLDGCIPLRTSAQKSSALTRSACSISDLSFFLLTQVAGKIVERLAEEAVLLGPRVERDFLSIVFNIQNNGCISLVAAPSGYCINWWLRYFTVGADDTAPSAPTSEKFLGPLPLEALRAVVMDLALNF